MVVESVHTAQRVFRAWLEAFSYPGRIVSLGSEDSLFPPSALWGAGLQSLCLTVLDPRTKVFFSGGAEHLRPLLQQTYAISSVLDVADFVVSLDSPQSWGNLLAACKIGTLEDPQTSATLLLEVEDLDLGEPVTCSGPGIRESFQIFLPQYGLWGPQRNKKNMEFPLGVEMVLVDRKARILGLPRTTTLEVF